MVVSNKSRLRNGTVEMLCYPLGMKESSIYTPSKYRRPVIYSDDYGDNSQE